MHPVVAFEYQQSKYKNRRLCRCPLHVFHANGINVTLAVRKHLTTSFNGRMYYSSWLLSGLTFFFKDTQERFLNS